MTNDTSIFSLRFGSNAKIEPSQDELDRFLESKKTGTRESHSADLIHYWDILAAVAGYKTTGGSGTFREKILYTVMDHSHFAKPALKSAVEQYKYHVNALSKIDFKKPAAFIKSAEEEIARLNPKKKEDLSRIERMRAMIEERRQTLDAQNKKWIELAEELNHIVAYISDNLSKIEKLCEKSIFILVNEQVEGKKETGLIEDIKAHFKQHLKDALHQGTIKKEDLDAAKEEVAALSKRAAEITLSDIYSMTQLYETIHDLAAGTVNEMGKLTGDIGARKHSYYDDDVELYSRVEKVLVDLLTNCSFDVKTPEIEAVTQHDELLVEKRKKMFGHLAERLQKET
jgi:hypothetical protein